MSRRRRRRLFAFVLCGVVVGTWAAEGRLAAQPPDEDQEITIDAESLSYDKGGEILSATGDVLIRRGDTTLQAETVELNRRTNEARAIGDAVLTSPDAQIRANAIFLDLENETGELQEADIDAARLGVSLSGTRIEKGLGQRYRIENGRFTTCACEEGAPDWSIAGDSLDITVDGYGTLEGGTFDILGVPVLWLPRAAFPVFRERQTGLLIPRVGISNRRGFQVLQPMYWAIDKSQDLTLSADLETSLRVGLIGEYRYAIDADSGGQFQVGYFNELFRGNASDVRVPPGADPVPPENRWAVIGHHDQNLPIDGMSGYLDSLIVGDDLFLREMNTLALDEREEVDLRTKPFTTSRLGILQDWSRASMQAEAVYYQDLVGPTVESEVPNCDPTVEDCVEETEDESLVIQRLPEVRVIAQKELGYGLMADFTGSATNFQRSLGLAGVRGDFKPSLQLRLPLGRSLFGTVRAAFRETAYGLTESQMAGGFTGQDLIDGPFIDLPDGSSREIVEIHGALGTQVTRVFDFPHLGLDKLKHTIEPQLDYLYVPDVNQDDLPVWDGIDRINERSLITYGFATRLIGRSAPDAGGERGEVFEISRLSVAQSYDPTRDIPPTSRLDDITGQPVNPGQKGDHFSDIDVALRVNPGPVTSVRAYTTYDASENNLSSATLGVRLTEPLRTFEEGGRPRLFTRASFAVEYRFITDSILQLLDSSIALPVTDRIALLYAMRYDIDAGSFLENYAGLRLLSSCDCWALNIGVTDTRNPNEVQVQAQFTLAGLGAAPITGF